MITDRQKFTTKITFYWSSSFHFHRWNQFSHSPGCTLRTWNLPKFSTTSDAGWQHGRSRWPHSVAGSQSTLTIKSRDTRPRRMQEVNSLCTDSRALWAESCIVGIPHNTAILLHMAVASAMSLTPNIFIHSAATSMILISKIFRAHEATTWFKNLSGRGLTR